MPKISEIKCHKIVNSRGDWTIETNVTLDDGSVGIQSIPEGASKGENEALSLPADRAVEIVDNAIHDALVGEDPFDQEKIDGTMLQMDGTSNKAHLGGNSILSVSLATSQAAAQSKQLELYQYLGQIYRGGSDSKGSVKFPIPIFNILNGGKHAKNNLSFQEFMVIPSGSKNFVEAMEAGVDIYHRLKLSLIKDGYEVAVGDEGGFAPEGFTTHKALHYVRNAVSARHKPGIDVFFGVDVAAESFHQHDSYVIPEEKLTLTNEHLAKYYAKLMKDFELIYIEDPFYEKDITGWKNFYKAQSKNIMIVGDDLVVTNATYLEKAANEELINAVIVKPNQVGTLSETFKFIKLAQSYGMQTILSHRSGDTAEDTFIADLALAVGADFIKAGAPVRGERVAKYNRLLEIYFSL